MLSQSKKVIHINRSLASIVFIFLSLICFGQDSLLKTRLKLFDVTLRFSLGFASRPETNLKFISSFTNHKEYVSDAFTHGYSDSIKQTHFHEGFGPTAIGEIGINASFQLLHTKWKFLQRMKPRFGFNYSTQKLFEYEIGYRNQTVVDSLHFVNPTYPATPIDSITMGNINYSYYTQRIYIELGANFDIILKRRFILYAGFLYNYGVSYDNQFSINKYEYYYIDKPGEMHRGELSSVNQTFTEPNSTSSRIILPFGIQYRPTLKHRFCVSFLAELRPGVQSYKSPNGGSTLNGFIMLNTGLRFNFRYFK